LSEHEHDHSHEDEDVTKGFPLPASKEKIDSLKVAKILLTVFSCLTLGVGVYFAIAMYIPLGGFHNVIAVGIAQFCGFLMIAYLLVTLLLLKLIPKEKKSSAEQDDFALRQASKKHIKINKLPLRKIVAVLGLGLVIVNSIPLLMTPVAIQTAENEFEEAYGENWRDQIPDNINSFFMQSQFNLYNYFVGFPHPDVNVDRNVEYFRDTAQDNYFLFDVYYPKSTTRELPGHNSTIIKIHGGGWTEGDKSEGHTLWINKYLAAQGYIVFDIQYGLLDTGSHVLPTPEHVLGNYNLSDMIRHIGIFTYLLESNFSTIYQARLDSVFVMGGSAGGHLTGVVGLGYNDAYFAGNFSNALTLKGIVPIYPANDIEHIDSGDRASIIDGDRSTNPLAYEKFTPSELADANDPDAIFFQGTHDGMVPPKNSEDIEAALEAVGVNGIVCMFPFAAHANDYLTNNNFAQVWCYYLERFLYLQQIV